MHAQPEPRHPEPPTSVNVSPGFKRGKLSLALLVLVLLVAPVIAHLALVVHHGMAIAGILIAVQAVFLTWIVSASITRPVLRAGACGVVFLSLLFIWWSTDGIPLVASAVPHAMAYLMLLAVFAISLQPGRVAIVTTLAREARGHLPGEIVRYTRRVTWAWCWFFMAQLLGSLMLLLFTPLEVWSLFVNLCNLPLIGVMLSAEYIYRQWRHAAQPPERLIDTIRHFRRLGTGPR
jgi:uncharacterized membrane protein